MLYTIPAPSGGFAGPCNSGLVHAPLLGWQGAATPRESANLFRNFSEAAAWAGQGPVTYSHGGRRGWPGLINWKSAMTSPGKPAALLTLRAALILFFSVLAAAAAAGLTWLYQRNAAEAALAGLGAFAAAAKFFDWLIA
jgi:hypothetical protein